MKKLLITILKISISLAIIGYLVWDATHGKNHRNVFADLVQQPKRWDLLALAALFSFTAVLLTLIRWYYLVRALDMPIRLKDALRIGFLGYLFNLAPLGIVGGDLLKAFMLGHENPGCRAKALASVVIDRVIGLYMLFAVATSAILATGLWRSDETNIRRICLVTLAVTAVGAVAIGILLMPGLSSAGLVRLIEDRLPLRLRGAVVNLIAAGEMYRRKLGVLAMSAVMSVFVHGSFAIGVYFVARGLPGEALPFNMFFVVMPLAAVAGVIPLPLGPFEGALEYLYTRVPAGVVIHAGQGLVIALAYRLITLGIAAIGFGYYLTSRREVAEVMHEEEGVESGEWGVESGEWRVESGEG